MPKDMQRPEGDEAYKAGVALYKRGRFREASREFTRALASHPTSLEILDARASAYQRLGNVTSGLADGSRMITADPGDPRGYLRAGKCLLLDKKGQEAMEVYRQATTNCRTSHPFYPIIEKQIQVLMGMPPPAVRRDPMRILPTELILDILSYIDTPTMVGLLRVSRLWEKRARGSAEAWRNVRLPSRSTVPGFRMDNRTFTEIARVGGRRVRELHMRDAGMLTGQGLKALVKHRCFSIQRLALPYRSKIPPAVFLSTLKVVGASVRTLSVSRSEWPLAVLLGIIHEGTPGVETLILDGAGAMATHAWPASRRYPQVKRLSLRGLHFPGNGDIPMGLWQAFPHVVDLDVSGGSVSLGAMLEARGRLGGLEVLRVTGRGDRLHEALSEEAQGESPMGGWWPGLRRLEVGNHLRLSDAFFLRNLPSWTNLRAVDVSGSSVGEGTVRALSRWCPGLEEFLGHGVQGGSGLGDGAVGMLVRGCPSLRVLGMGRSGITDAGLEMLGGCEALRILRIPQCGGITNRGLMEFVRGRGVRTKLLDIQGCETLREETVQAILQVLGGHRLVR